MLRKAVGLLVNAGLRAVALALLAGAVAIPAFAYWHASRPREYGPATQVSVPLPAGAPAGVPVPRHRDGVLVLCYHDLSDEAHNRDTVRPAVFAAQMVALRDAGFHTIGAGEFTRFVQGRKVALPSRPLLITFDDGAKGTWIYADRILARLSFRATVFLITGDVSHYQPYYLDWPEVEAMQASGRWSFGSHTADGHGLIPSDDHSDTGPFLTNRRWLRGRGRLESLAAYRRRVADDLDRSMEEIESHGLPRPSTFSYPFSATVEPTNDPAIRPLLSHLLRRRFAALLDNTPHATLIQAGARGPLPRVEVLHDTTAKTLLREARATVLGTARSSAGGA